MATVAPVLSEIIYPEFDGEPMGETPIHRNQMAHVIEMLDDYYAAEPLAYVSGNMMMYYVEGNPKKCVSPDVFVTLGIPKLPERRIYQTWLEGKGPDFVVEMHSRGTWRSDVGWKLDLYRDVLKVPEYFLFDPLEERPNVKSLRGYRLVNGVYQPIPETDGRLASEVLGLHLEAAGERLRLYDPRRGVYLLDPREVREALAREEEARRAAEVRVEWEARARAAADERAAQEARARAAADDKAVRESAARTAAEAEGERLRREIEGFRRAKPARILRPPSRRSRRLGSTIALRPDRPGADVAQVAGLARLEHDAVDHDAQVPFPLAFSAVAMPVYSWPGTRPSTRNRPSLSVFARSAGARGPDRPSAPASRMS